MLRQQQSDEDKSLIRLNRAMIAAGAAVTVAVVGSIYAIYRAQAVIDGLKGNIESTTALYSSPDDSVLRETRK